MVLAFIFIVFYLAPVIISAQICEDRYRSVAKGVFITLFFGWFATVGLWLALKRRNPETLQLY